MEADVGLLRAENAELKEEISVLTAQVMCCPSVLGSLVADMTTNPYFAYVSAMLLCLWS